MLLTEYKFTVLLVAIRAISNGDPNPKDIATSTLEKIRPNNLKGQDFYEAPKE